MKNVKTDPDHNESTVTMSIILYSFRVLTIQS